jgi:hypothetical protein
MLSEFKDVFTDFLVHKDYIYFCGFYCKFFTRELSPVNYSKKSVVDNIGPSTNKRCVCGLGVRVGAGEWTVL